MVLHPLLPWKHPILLFGFILFCWQSAVPEPSAATGDMPVLFVHGHGAGPDIEDTWEDLVKRYLDGYKGYTFQRDLYEGSARRLATGSLPAKSIFLFHYYRTEKIDGWGNPPGQIGGLQKSHTKHNILVKLNPFYSIEYDHSRPSYAQRLATAVDNVLRATGASKVMLVGHSMGGLVSRA